MVNKYQPHVLVLPEDQANIEIANGFLLTPSLKARNLRVLPCCHGWLKVLEGFVAQISEMEKLPNRRMILLIDFDQEFAIRSHYVFDKIPNNLRSRVFVLGTADEPEKPRTALGKSMESIGKDLGDACANRLTDGLWQHRHLQHNQPELERLLVEVRPILFD